LGGYKFEMSGGDTLIRVTVTLVPHGNENEASEINHMIIANDLSGSPTMGNYEYRIDDNPDRIGKVFHHERNTEVWKLIYKVLDQEYGDN
jgi:hypothetical protein